MIDEILKAAGPYTAPMVALISVALRWAMKDRDRLLALLAAADQDRFSLREKRATDLEQAAIEYRKFGEASREIQTRWVATMQTILDTIKSGSGGPAK
jgi:hypothetical protein